MSDAETEQIERDEWEVFVRRAVATMQGACRWDFLLHDLRSRPDRWEILEEAARRVR